MSRGTSVRKATCVDDLRQMARRRVPRAFFEYNDVGSYAQTTLRANRADLDAIRLRQRVGVDVTTRDLTTTVLGQQVTLPLGLGPVGLCGMQWGDGEILACRAAQAAGIPFCLSTMSVCSIEDVAAAVDQPFWFQLYMVKDHDFVRDLIGRASAADCGALVITLDLNLLGQRHADIKNGLTVPPRITASNAIDFATKPSWARSVLRGKRKTFGNLAGHLPGDKSVTSIARWATEQVDPSMSWKDIEWVRDIWPGKIILKGILDVADAKIAAQLGVSAIVVSNHGGRQLDGAPSSISALPDIVAAVGSEVEVLIDSGIRSGQDVLKALALGARACLIGRAYIYGLSAGGQDGVARAIELIRGELDVSMALTGTTSVKQIGRDVLT